MAYVIYTLDTFHRFKSLNQTHKLVGHLPPDKDVLGTAIIDSRLQTTVVMYRYPYSLLY